MAFAALREREVGSGRRPAMTEALPPNTTSSLLLFWAGYLLILAVPGPNMVLVGTLAAVKGLRGVLPLVSGLGVGASALATVVYTTAGSVEGYPALAAAGRWSSGIMLTWIAWRIAWPRNPADKPRWVRRLTVGEFGAGFITAATNPISATYFLATALTQGSQSSTGEIIAIIASAAAGAVVKSLALAAVVSQLAARGGGMLRPALPLRFVAATGLLLLAIAGVARPF
jgi:threonine/homoserine/homoserine lactone efflux protein